MWLKKCHYSTKKPQIMDILLVVGAQARITTKQNECILYNIHVWKYPRMPYIYNVYYNYTPTFFFNIHLDIMILWCNDSGVAKLSM